MKCPQFIAQAYVINNNYLLGPKKHNMVVVSYIVSFYMATLNRMIRYV
jgi:hypothetical protein